MLIVIILAYSCTIFEMCFPSQFNLYKWIVKIHISTGKNKKY